MTDARSAEPTLLGRSSGGVEVWSKDGVTIHPAGGGSPVYLSHAEFRWLASLALRQETVDA